MSFTDADGNVLNKTEMLALTTAGDSVTPRVFTGDVYQRFTFDGAKTFEGGQKLAFHAGQVVPSTDIDALFVPATVDSIVPASGAAAGGTNLVINGKNLSGAEGVTIGGNAATNFKVVSNTRITCTAPAHAAGAVTVVVKDDAGDVTKPTFYTYV